MVLDRERQQTLVARQSRLVLESMLAGLWDFMSELELDEVESDAVIEEMLNGDDKGDSRELRPVRRADRDALCMKRRLLFMQNR